MTARFFQRPYPNANAVLLEGVRPALVDPGSGSDLPDLLVWLADAGVWPALVVNTHWHSDHAGANHALQERGLPIAAPAAEAAAVNARHIDACRALWLAQPIESYVVDRVLLPNDLIGTGMTQWRVLALPGHTAHQIGLVCDESGVLVAGDALHDADIGWLDIDADPAALDQAEATIDAIAELAPRRVLPGHGPAIRDVPSAILRARRRLATWRENPERIAWHACKRIFTHALMLEGGADQARLEHMLLAAPWFRDHARRAFGLTPEEFLPKLLAETLRSGAALWRDGRLQPAAPYSRVSPDWPAGPSTPSTWPPAAARAQPVLARSRDR